MIMGDKISVLRRKNGWSQEELAEKMGVSRQAVSKWESAQSIPDLTKILQLAELFGVTTDYLLRDEQEEAEYDQTGGDTPSLRRVTLEEANIYLKLREKAADWIARGVFLCIASPVCLLLLSVVSERHMSVSDALAAGVGLIVLLGMVAAAVAMFVMCGNRNAEFEFLDKEPFETEYGVEGMVRERQKAARSSYQRSNLLGVCLCVLSPIPLFVGVILEMELMMVAMVCATLLIAGVGVMFFVSVGVRWSAMQRLLQEGDFAPDKKQREAERSRISTAYWLLAVAVYLGWSFVSDDWQQSWLVWPVAGVLYAGLIARWETKSK